MLRWDEISLWIQTNNQDDELLRWDKISLWIQTNNQDDELLRWDKISLWIQTKSHHLFAITRLTILNIIKGFVKIEIRWLPMTVPSVPGRN